MRFKSALAALAVLSLTGPALADPTVPGDRQSLDTSNAQARQMWADVIASTASQQLSYAPTVYTTSIKDRYGRTVMLSQFQSGPTCGVQACQSRLFIDGKQVQDTMTCGEFDKVQFGADGTFYSDCGQRVDVPLPPG